MSASKRNYKIILQAPGVIRVAQQGDNMNICIELLGEYHINVAPTLALKSQQLYSTEAQLAERSSRRIGIA